MSSSCLLPAPDASPVGPGGSAASKVPRETPVAPPPPDVATDIYGDRLSIAVRYVEHLATTGIERGLIGPREVARLWERHVLNCAVIAEVIPLGMHVSDIGSGAGLPGLALAIARTDLDVVLVEPLQRRSEWLQEVVADLDLATVTVVRARAEDLAGSLMVDVVTARAVSSLDRLAQWTLPLLRPGGELIAIKGRNASSEVAAAERTMRRLGARSWSIVQCGGSRLEPPTTVVRVRQTDDRGDTMRGPRAQRRKDGAQDG